MSLKSNQQISITDSSPFNPCNECIFLEFREMILSLFIVNPYYYVMVFVIYAIYIHDRALPLPKVCNFHQIYFPIL